MIDKLAILYGGPTSEKNVSIETKEFFCKLYREYKPLEIKWLENDHFIINNKKLNSKQTLKFLSDNDYSVLIASHGEKAEDGYIQKKFEKFNIPFTGSDSSSSKLTMNKILCQKKVKKIINIIPTFRSYKKLAFPFVAKPNNLGSSIGVFLIKNNNDLLKNKRFFNKNYIFQQYIRGRELSLSCVRKNKKYIKLYPTEIIPKYEFFDYNSKYKKGMSDEITPARISNDVLSRLINATNKIHDTLGLGYYSRSDFILDKRGKIYYLETNSLPGMTSTSLLPQQLAYSNKLEIFKKGLLKNLIKKAVK